MRNTWHLLHLVMTVLTGGLWLLVWLWCSFSNSGHNKKMMYKAMIANATGQPIKPESDGKAVVVLIVVMGAIGYWLMEMSGGI